MSHPGKKAGGAQGKMAEKEVPEFTSSHWQTEATPSCNATLLKLPEDWQSRSPTAEDIKRRPRREG